MRRTGKHRVQSLALPHCIAAVVRGFTVHTPAHAAGALVAAVPLEPKRVLTLAQELLTRGVQAIEADS